MANPARAAANSDSVAVVITEPSGLLFVDPFFPRLLRGISAERDRKSHEFLYEGGIVSFVKDMNKNKTPLHDQPIFMQGQKDLESVSRLIMSELTPLVSAHHGAFFIMDNDAGAPMLRLIASYAYRARKHVGNRFGIEFVLAG